MGNYNGDHNFGPGLKLSIGRIFKFGGFGSVLPVDHDGGVYFGARSCRGQILKLWLRISFSLGIVMMELNIKMSESGLFSLPKC